jgi:hypothetical protein
MTNLLESLQWADGQINPSGIATEIYYALKSEIKTMARIQRTPVPSTAEDNVNLAGDHEMQLGKFWKKLYSTQGVGKVNWEALGEKDHKMFLNKGMFSFPDISVAARSLAKQSINSNVVFVIKLPHESEVRYVQIGDADYDVTVTIKGDSGDKPGSAKGLTIEIESPCTTPLPGYVGAIVLEDGILDCETGIFTESIS